MEHIYIREFGESEVLKLESIEPDEPGPGQARIKVAAIGVNFIDIYRRRGTYPVELPYTPGFEAAGVVEKIGDGVKDVKPGDRVAYANQPGSYTEKAIVKADALIPIPDDLPYEQAAAFPLQGLTAHYLLHEFQKPSFRHTVLIHAAAGGMGLLLVQWARHLGARVIGTVSSDEKAAAARVAGADEIIMYKEQDFVRETNRLTDGKGADIIIDGVGKSTFQGNLEACARRGNIIIFGAASGPAEPVAPNMLQHKSLTISGGALWNFISTRQELLMRSREVLAGIKAGWLKLRIDNILPLSHAGEAHRLLEERRSIGKIVLTTPFGRAS